MRAALVVFDGMTFLDFVGFYDAVTRLRSMKIMDDFDWSICSLACRVTDDRGLTIEAQVVGEGLGGYDLLFVPGGRGTRRLRRDSGFVEWLKTAEPVPLKTSVCTGALLLGAAGFLRGRRATTHPRLYRELKLCCAEVIEQRIVDDGDVITAGGVSSAIDLGLHVVAKLAGAATRDLVAAQMDYPYRWVAPGGERRD